jgi:hypothetical protein
VYTYITSRRRAMTDQLEPTPEEAEQVPDEQDEHEAMRGPGHEEPPGVEEIDDGGPEAP